jgi:DNA-binding SARP family transcriptional activator
MSQLQLLLLGTPIVKHGEHILSFSSRKALALLVYLAVEGGTHTRKTLTESFWPELDAEHGRAALRATLLELCKLLERCHETGERAHLRSNAIRLESSRAASPFWIFSSSNLPASKQDTW